MTQPLFIYGLKGVAGRQAIPQITEEHHCYQPQAGLNLKADTLQTGTSALGYAQTHRKYLLQQHNMDEYARLKLTFNCRSKKELKMVKHDILYSHTT